MCGWMERGLKQREERRKKAKEREERRQRREKKTKNAHPDHQTLTVLCQEREGNETPKRIKQTETNIRRRLNGGTNKNKWKDEKRAKTELQKDNEKKNKHRDTT